METKKIIMIGGSGFIGNHLVQKLIDNNDLTIFDLQKPSNTNCNFIKGDIFNFDLLKSAISSHDVIIHLTGLADASKSQKDPTKSFDLNIRALHNALEACRQLGGKKLIFPSSAAVYGSMGELPIKESYPPHPTNIYACHKVICEKMIQAYQSNYDIQYVILRLFNVYGRGNKGVIDMFINKASKGELIESFGPQQYRDFVYAGDVADAISYAAIYDKSENRTINIGSGRGTQIREIIEIICDIFPNAKWIEKKTPFVRYDSIADITLAKLILGFNPSSSKEFMRKTIEQEMIPERSIVDKRVLK